MIRRVLVLRDKYFDSVTLMQVTNDVKKADGVRQAVVGMGTDFNLESMKRLDLLLPDAAGSTPNDLIIVLEAENEAAAENAIAFAQARLTKRRAGGGPSEYIPPTLSRAMEMAPEANLVLISTPGRFAAAEARTALLAGKHVMLFSDNVTLDEELALKQLAVSRGLLMMGPDCGTAIINGAPLAFANAVRRGSIGIVAASGTGLQEACCAIHRMGHGISQAIGVGGRDLSEKIGGLMTLLAAKALGDDPETKIILLISKPPAASTQKKLFAELKGLGKPVVVYFIGADPAEVERAGFIPAAYLEDAARMACGLAPEEISQRPTHVSLPGPFVRGLYSGGTLCDEAQRLLLPVLGRITSNTPISGAEKSLDVYTSDGHTFIDLGDDDFTRGRAHPMIDPTMRKERLEAEIANPETGLIMLDVVLGFGSHPDMASELAASITSAGRKPVIVASICGTDGDPQDSDRQSTILSDAGVRVFPSHIGMVRFVQGVMSER